MIYNTLEQAQAAQKAHFERSKASCYAKASNNDKLRLDSYYQVTKAIYEVRQTSDGKFEYPGEDGIYVGKYAQQDS